jgi:hypothetical protein
LVRGYWGRRRCGQDAHAPFDSRSTICSTISASLGDLGCLAVNLSERVGAARPRRPTGDGLGQDVPATVKMRARCPRSRVESGFISVLGLSTFGPSTLHFQNFRISEFQRFSFYPQGWDKCWYRQKISEKSFGPGLSRICVCP